MKRGDTITLQVAQRGVVTLPSALRKAYHLDEGDEMTLLDLGGVFVLSPRRSEVDRLADRIANRLNTGTATLEDMLSALRQERNRNGEEESLG